MSGALADGEQGDARGGKQRNGHTVRCDGRTGVGGAGGKRAGRRPGQPDKPGKDDPGQKGR